MKNNTIRIFLGGDVFGSVGLRCVSRLLPPFLGDEDIDFCVMNGENASGGIGLSEPDAKVLFDAGADVVTGGNHSFEKRDYWPVLDTLPGVLRPANFPSADENDEDRLPGRGWGVFEKQGVRIAVLNLQGREDMVPIDCPFRMARSLVGTWEREDNPPIVLIDFHAESTQEKEALACMLDGRVVAVAGTHTHVQTADERVLGGGTAYITDLGMTGPYRSVIGSEPVSAVKRNITQVLYRMEAPDVPGALRGLIIDVDLATRRAISVKRVEILEKS